MILEKMSPLFWNSIIARIYCVLICAILSSVFVWRLLFQEPSISNIFYHTNNVQKCCWLLNERMKSLVRLSLIPETCDQITSFRSQYLTPLFISIVFQGYSRLRNPLVFFIRMRHDSFWNSPAGFPCRVRFHTGRLWIHVCGKLNYRLQSNKKFAGYKNTRGKFRRDLAGIGKQHPSNQNPWPDLVLLLHSNSIDLEGNSPWTLSFGKTSSYAPWIRKNT